MGNIFIIKDKEVLKGLDDIPLPNVLNIHKLERTKAYEKTKSSKIVRKKVRA